MTDYLGACRHVKYSSEMADYVDIGYSELHVNGGKVFQYFESTVKQKIFGVYRYFRTLGCVYEN